MTPLFRLGAAVLWGALVAVAGEQAEQLVALEGVGITNTVQLGMNVLRVPQCLNPQVTELNEAGKGVCGYIGTIPSLGIEFTSQSGGGRIDKIDLNVDTEDTAKPRFRGVMGSGLTLVSNRAVRRAEIVGLYGDLPVVETASVLAHMRRGLGCSWRPAGGIELLYYTDKGVMFELRSNRLIRVMIERAAPGSDKKLTQSAAQPGGETVRERPKTSR
jgi:hypothetical protein